MPGQALGKCDAAEGILAAIFARDERSVKSTHQNVIPERGGVVLFGVCRGKRCSGPRERQRVMSANPIGLQHVAAFIYIEAIGWIGWVAQRIEHTRGSEGVATPQRTILRPAMKSKSPAERPA